MLHGRLTAILAATGYDVTCSMGALVMDAREQAGGEKLVERADALMYEVKRAGKNAVRTAHLGATGTAMSMETAGNPVEQPGDGLHHAIAV